MRIIGQSLTGVATQPRSNTSATAAGGFQVPIAMDARHPSTGQIASLSVPSLQGLMALQEEIEAPQLRRQKAARRGFNLLDALGTLKAGLLGGKVDERAIKILQSHIRQGGEGEQDPVLKSVLNGIEIRTAVELAKLGR